MYNRYLSDEAAPYVRSRNDPPRQNASPVPPPTEHGPPPQGGGNGGSGTGGSPLDRIQSLLHLGGPGQSGETPLRRLLTRFHLEDVDTGDLLLLVLLFFLLEEKADDELLIALGLLLIL